MDIFPELIPAGSLWLLVAPRAARDAMIDLAARLALRGPLRVLDGGNQFNAYRCSRAAAQALCLAPGEQKVPTLEEILNRISVARAFTCYQMLALLVETAARITGSSPGVQNPAAPTLVLDLPAMFYDESVDTGEARRLLETSIAHLQRLSRAAPVVVSAAPFPDRAPPERIDFLDMLEAVASQAWFLEAPRPVEQPRFPF